MEPANRPVQDELLHTDAESLGLGYLDEGNDQHHSGQGHKIDFDPFFQ